MWAPRSVFTLLNSTELGWLIVISVTLLKLLELYDCRSSVNDMICLEHKLRILKRKSKFGFVKDLPIKTGLYECG